MSLGQDLSGDNRWFLHYRLPSDGKGICSKVVLAGWYNELGPLHLNKIMVGDLFPGYVIFSNDPSHSPDHPLPVTVGNANVACAGTLKVVINFL